MIPLYQIDRPDCNITITENGRCNISGNQIYDIAVRMAVDTKYTVNKTSYICNYNNSNHPSNTSFDNNGNLIIVSNKSKTVQVTDYMLDALLRGIQHKPLYRSQNGILFTCRESAIIHLAYYKQKSLRIDCDLTSQQLDKLHEWTKHHPITLKNRVLCVDRWWCNNIKAGWLLLAIRLLSGRQFSQSEKLATKFFQFIKDPNSIKVYMTHSHNWLRIFK